MAASETPLPPGAMGLPFLGETFAFLKDPFDFFETRYRQHGPVFKTKLLGDKVVVFVGPEAFAFFNDPANVTRENGSPKGMQELLHPAAIPFLDGEAFRKRKAFMMQAFTREALASYRHLAERVIARHLGQMVAAREINGARTLGFLGFTLADVLFAGADPDKDAPEQAELCDKVLAGVTAVPIKFPGNTYSRALAARDQFRARIAATVDAFQPGQADHVLARLVASGMPRDEIKIESFHFFFAAFAAVQAALCDLIVALAQHPELLAAARAEVLRVAPTGDVAGKLDQLDLVHRIGLEVRRYYRIAPATFFGIVTHDNTFAGKRIPAGWKAVAVPHSTMRDDKVFPNADRFDPDRYLPGRAEDKPPHHWVPHGTGDWLTAHRCAGEALATLLIDTFCARLVRDVKLELPEQDLTYKMAGLASLPASGLIVRMSAQSAA